MKLPTKEEVDRQKELDRKRKREDPPLNHYLVLDNDKIIQKKRTKPMIYYDPEIAQFKDYKIGTEIDVWIDKKYIASVNSAKKIWGTDVYTEDSDIVLICHHMGHLNLSKEFDRLQSIAGLKTTIKILELPKNGFKGSYRHGLRSNEWNVSSTQHCAISVLKCSIARDTLVGTHAKDLMLSTDPNLAASAAFSSLLSATATDPNRNSLYLNLNTMLQRNRVLDGLTIVYNRKNEPCVRFTLDDVKDKGPHPTQYTSFRLQSSCLYIESSDATYEIAYVPAETAFKLSRVLLNTSNYPTVPLSNPNHIKPILKELKWKEFIWSREALQVRDFSITPLSVSWVPRTDVADNVNKQLASS